MSDNDGLAGSSSSNGGGVNSDGGGVGAGHTTLSGAVEQADKAIRDSAASIVGWRDIVRNLFDDHLSGLPDKLDPFDVLRFDLCLNESETGYFCIASFLKGGRLSFKLHLDMPRTLDPTEAEHGGHQQSDSADADEHRLRRE